MTRILVRPHRTAGQERVKPDMWEVTCAGATSSDPRELSGWDYATDLSVRLRLSIDRLGVLEDCGLPDSAAVGAVLCWHSRRTATRGASAPVRITDETTTEVAVDLPGAELGGTLELVARLVLLTARPSADSLAAHREGSILWEGQVHRTVLEGTLSRFPVTVVDFADHAHLANGALWGLGWNPTDIERPALGAICLYVNSAHPAHGALTAELDRTDLVDALRVDIARTLLDGALDDPDFEHTDHEDSESLGAVIAHLLDVVFPELDTATVRELRRARRSYYESTIQAVVGIGGS